MKNLTIAVTACRIAKVIEAKGLDFGHVNTGSGIRVTNSDVVRDLRTGTDEVRKGHLARAWVGGYAVPWSGLRVDDAAPVIEGELTRAFGSMERLQAL